MDDNSLTLKHYQERASQSDHGPQTHAFPFLGLFGEVGSLLSEVKKQQRDSASYVGYKANVLEELGDVLWYVTTIASRANISIVDVAYSAWTDSECVGRAPNTFRFMELQSQQPLFSPTPTPAFETTLMHLAAAVGALANDYRQGIVANDQDTLAAHLIKVLKVLLTAADEAGVTLAEAAENNLEKIFDRWPVDQEFPNLFDEGFPEHEQLPRKITLDIFEYQPQPEKNSYVMQRCNGIYIGNRLTDNMMRLDDYRFHDVFHYAYTAVLGWSPVTRALFRLKRKSDSRIDEGEDGARAVLIEEGIATWLFGQAKKLQFFENMKPGDLSFDLLKNVRKFVSGYEVESRPLWMWEEAILQGYAAFRFLRKHRGGTVHVDMVNHRLTVEKLQSWPT